MNDFIWTSKPVGLATHSPDQKRLGFVELLSLRDQQKYYVVHRLDKDTSGGILLATSPSAAASLTQAFTERNVKKTYLLVTDKKRDLKPFTIESQIEKNEKIYVSSTLSTTPNSRTEFELLKEDGGLYLWQAQPLTGKTHQIRLHAKDAGIPILGDNLYGGGMFPRLMLHAYQLTLNDQVYTSTPGLLFSQINLCHNRKLANLLAAYERRQTLYPKQILSDQTMRIVHSDNKEFRIDKLGEWLWIYWYKDEAPTAIEEKLIAEFTTLIKAKGYLIRKMQNRGEDPNSSDSWNSAKFPKVWQSKEHELNFEFRSEAGLSPGLFLDQRVNRRWVQQNSHGKSVLNLFSYTGGFSVAAAMGDAEEVVSVDLSYKFNEWAKQNFKLNNLMPLKYEFWDADALVFLKGATTRNKKFDLIICDPPSFSRGPKSIFRLEKDLTTLLKLLDQVLHHGGQLLFSTNFEKWTVDDLRKEFKTHLRSYLEQPLPHADLDYELPGESSLMKSILFSKGHS